MRIPKHNFLKLFSFVQIQNGNISVTKSEIPFVCIGADHACKQLKIGWWKVHSIGISQLVIMPMHYRGYFLPDQKCHTSEQSIKGSLGSGLIHHKSIMRYKHMLAWKRMMLSTGTTILSQGNPFDAEGDQLHDTCRFWKLMTMGRNIENMLLSASM